MDQSYPDILLNRLVLEVVPIPLIDVAIYSLVYKTILRDFEGIHVPSTFPRLDQKPPMECQRCHFLP